MQNTEDTGITRRLELLQHYIDQNPKQYINYIIYSTLGFMVFSFFIGTLLGIVDVAFGTQFLFFDDGFIEHTMFPLVILGISIIAIPNILVNILSTQFFQSLTKNLENLYGTESRVENLDEILKYTKGILQSCKYFFYLRKILHSIVATNGLDMTISWLQDELNILLPYLNNLQSDLSIRMREQIIILETAKSEIDRIKQTPVSNLSAEHKSGLKQISELQKTRLDRQIEQFEELQKVLI